MKVKKTLKNLNVVQTQDAVFSLELTHKDVRGAQWIKNGVEIQPSDKYEITIEDTFHTLKIRNCTTQDESVYSFKLGKLSANARLNVESKQPTINLKNNDTRFHIFSVAEHKNIEVQQKVTEQILKCSVKYSPQPSRS